MLYIEWKRIKMQQKILYEKPKMKFVELRSSQKVADECFNGIKNKDKLYFNTVGLGYVSFSLTGRGNCNTATDSFVVTITGYGPDGFVPTPEQAGKMQAELEAFVAANDDQPNFKGSTVEITPDPSWS